MPRSAMEAGYVDVALPPAELASELARLSCEPYIFGPTPREETGAHDDAGLPEVLRVVRAAAGMDFAR